MMRITEVSGQGRDAKPYQIWQGGGTTLDGPLTLGIAFCIVCRKTVAYIPGATQVVWRRSYSRRLKRLEQKKLRWSLENDDSRNLIDSEAQLYLSDFYTQLGHFLGRIRACMMSVCASSSGSVGRLYDGDLSEKRSDGTKVVL